MDKRALLVNDSRFESLILKDMLNGLGYDVELADEFDAIYEAEQFEPHLVIVNYIMRKIKGDELIKDIKSSIPESKCLLSSNGTVNREQLEDTVDGVLHTPISMFTLKDSLRRIGEYEEKISFLDQDQRQSKMLHFCPYCASSLKGFSEEIVFCPYCGKSMQEILIKSN
ncbi:response regulator [Vallitalea pronyensis]|uniref:Stage 0 sporulation protein A homolog n=1 Tax=Vallitalea pronyensis TaxID=1348613 RepID=A0A8J8MMS5_9FIRM|nr:response regulator [Vallitalea pronyensis]QUI24406.1 response regulator [Vallitalea pronyensis]